MSRRKNGTGFELARFSPLTAVGYVRVSTIEQAQEGVSLAAQEERIRAYCVSAGLDLSHMIREEGVSGSRPLADRPAGGGELLALLGPTRAQHLVALKLDRLFRSAVDALNQTQRWDQSGVALHLVDMGGQSMNTRSAIGRMMLTMMAAFAEFERNLIAERTTMALRHKKAHRNVYARIPLGFRRVGDELVEEPAELATVERIQELRTLGLTLTQIADELTRSGAQTKRGGQWAPATVSYILKNDLYDDMIERQKAA